MERSDGLQHDRETVLVEKEDVHSPQASTPDAGEVLNNQTSNGQKKPPAKADDASQVEDLDPAAERLAKDPTPLTLEDFYSLLGVRMPTSSSDALRQLAHPTGLYSQIYKEMQYNNRKFKR